MTLDIVNKITKTYDHDNKLVKMIDEDLTNLGNVNISYFEYYIFFVLILENIIKADNSVFHRIRMKITPYGWILLIFILASLSLLFI